MSLHHFLKRRKMDQRSRYYQTITKNFLQRRGAPFFLSSKEVDVIRLWEKSRIPLRVVLEGIRMYFERPKGRKGRQRSGVSIVLCDSFVRKAFESFKMRAVGRNQKITSRDEKARRMAEQTRMFLKSLPGEVSYLKNDFELALKLLETNPSNEEELEMLDQKVDESLIAHADDAVLEKIRLDVQSEYNQGEELEMRRIVSIKCSKKMREDFHIPRLSFFYY